MLKISYHDLYLRKHHISACDDYYWFILLNAYCVFCYWNYLHLLFMFRIIPYMKCICLSFYNCLLHGNKLLRSPILFIKHGSLIPLRRILRYRLEWTKRNWTSHSLWKDYYSKFSIYVAYKTVLSEFLKEDYIVLSYMYI